jgi:uncharacterized protein YbjT (DUF2867 family)
VREPFPDAPVAVLDPHDIAAVAATALVTSDHAGRAYLLSGPEPLLPADRLRILGEALGRDLRLHALSHDQAREEMSAQMPKKYVDAMFSFYVDGTLDESRVLPTVEEVLHRPGRTFQEWTLEHVDEFR